MDYIPDFSSKERKRLELIRLVANDLDAQDKHLAEYIVDSFCHLTPPKDAPVLIHYITLYDSGASGGDTRKPGNLRLNWKKLFGELGDIALNTVSAIAIPSLIPFAALSLWNTLWIHSNIPLSREHATTLYAMWQGRDTHNRISETDAQEKTGLLFQLYQWPPMELNVFSSILRDLVRLECIERKERDSIWLREWVKTTYS